ncbi:hypothetical protein I4U23_012122 [Adineta vaga]|nr:hypothetical protein I4U23_012122 [Adineta vaga]
MSRTTNSSLLRTTTQIQQGRVQYFDTSVIIGVSVGCSMFVAVLLIICYGLPTVITPPVVSPPPARTHVVVAKELPVFTPMIPKAKSDDIVPQPKPVRLSDLCPRNLCIHYSKRILRLNKAYFDFTHDRCFCSHCYPSTKTDRFTVAKSDYTVPRGWTRFGLRIDQTFADDNTIFKQWYTSFYGTSKNKIESIVGNRFIPKPGDHLLSGDTFTTHLSDKEHIYTSPSIHYASLKHICRIDTVNMNNEWYDVNVILECKQNPDGIVKQRGYVKNVCQIISDQEIEWKTKRRSSVVPYGLLIRVRKHRCTHICRDSHT